MTRSVLDTGVMLDVLAGQDHSFEYAARARPTRLRIAVVKDVPMGARGRLSDDVRGALDSTADLLRSLGHTVDGTIEMRPRDVPAVLGLMFRAIHDLVEAVERPQRLERRTRAFARPGKLVSDGMTERLLAAEGAMVRRIGSIFDDHDVLLTPVMSTSAVPAGIMEGRGAIATYLWETGWVPFTILWNLTGQPAASVPARNAADGLPVAVQLVGRQGDESTLLSLAAELEAERPWTDRRPQIA
jgi:amidase